MEEVSNPGMGPKTIQVYLIGKRDSYVIVAQLSPEFTARLVDRWQELEERATAPALPDFSNPAAVVFKQVNPGSVLPVQGRRVYATGTTASSLVALY